MLWLQAAEWYVDIRSRTSRLEAPPASDLAARFARDRAFAWTARWRDPVLTCEHLVDIDEHPVTDSHPLEWTTGGVLERGVHRSHRQDVPWVEEWQRVDAGEPAITVSDDRRRVQVGVGEWDVDVHDARPAERFVAVVHQRVDGCWRQIAEVAEG